MTSFALGVLCGVAIPALPALLYCWLARKVEK